MKIGLLGGSFNPIHNTHLRIIDNILKRKLVDEIWVLPCRDHPFNKKFESTEHRVNMIKIATKGMTNVKVCDVELKSEGKSYTYDTIKKLRENYSHAFYLIMGSDLLEDIERWHEYKKLVKEVNFIIFLRAGYPIKLSEDLSKSLIIKDDPNNTSSSHIRELLSASKKINYFVPKEIEEYIKQKGLYKNGI